MVKLYIVSVVNTYRWAPDIIDVLYVDDYDHHGLIYWYNAAKEQNDAINKKT